MSNGIHLVLIVAEKKESVYLVISNRCQSEHDFLGSTPKPVIAFSQILYVLTVNTACFMHPFGKLIKAVARYSQHPYKFPHIGGIKVNDKPINRHFA